MSQVVKRELNKSYILQNQMKNKMAFKCPGLSWAIIKTQVVRLTERTEKQSNGLTTRMADSYSWQALASQLKNSNKCDFRI